MNVEIKRMGTKTDHDGFESTWVEVHLIGEDVPERLQNRTATFETDKEFDECGGGGVEYTEIEQRAVRKLMEGKEISEKEKEILNQRTYAMMDWITFQKKVFQHIQPELKKLLEV